MKKGLIFSVVMVLVLGVGAVVGYGKYYQVTMPQFAQEKDNYCGVAVSQSFISYLTGYAWPQWQLAATSPEIAARLVAGKGLRADHVTEIMTVWALMDFDYHDHNSQSDAEKRIIKELKEQKHALAFAGNACETNGTPKSPMGHWMMVIMADVSDNKVKGVHVLDPLYGSSFAGGYETVRPYSYMRDLFSKWWLPKNGLRQSVEY